MAEKELFTKTMRRETRKIHNISDALINAKLGIAMSDNKIWAEGLLLFYEIFKYLESALDRLKDTQVATLDIPGMRRTAEFEKDLRFYLGESWKDGYTPHDSVLKYLSHLSDLEEHRPILLLAYLYHLYMGLFAGGQILKKKRAMVLKFSFSSEADSGEGLAVLNMAGGMFQMKKQMAEAMNSLVETLDDETKMALIEESKNVFRFNNEMVHSIKGANRVVVRKIIKMAAVIAMGAVLYFYWTKVRN